MRFSSIILLVVCWCSISYALVDPNATNETIALYSQLQNASGNYMYFGQHKFWYSIKGTQNDTYKITGKYPSVLSDDFREIRNDTNDTQQIRRHYRNGGIVSVMWHMGNPMTGGDAWNDTTNTCAACLPGGANRTDYLALLSNFSSWANDLKDDNGNLIPIIFRPFHETDGGGFWWSNNIPVSCSHAEYKQLWQDMVSYLQNQSVHNVIYCYSPSFYTHVNFTDRYPGNDYVDIIGIDRYVTANGSLVQNSTEIMPFFETASNEAYNRTKIFAITEGMKKVLSNTKEDYWTTDFINPILNNTNASRAAYIAVYTSPDYGPNATRIDNTSFLEMSNNPRIKFIYYKGIIIDGLNLTGVRVE
jgi:mannan endo-1,4-beta-mannosidase